MAAINAVRATIIAIVSALCFNASNVAALPIPKGPRNSVHVGNLILVSSRSGLPIPNRPRNYGPLGNLLAWLFEEASSDAATSMSGSATEMPPSEPPAKRQSDYGPLGNLIARLFNERSSEVAPAVEKPPAEPLTKMSSDTVADDPDKKTKKPRQHNYGPLGNLIVRMLHLAAGPSNEDPETPRKASAKPKVPVAKVPAMETKPNKVFQNVRELFKLLSSNFLQDPVLFQAAEALKQRDQRCGIDAEPGEGGFLMAAERDRLLQQAGTKDRAPLAVA